MREAAGRCFVQVGLPYGGTGTVNGQHLATAEDYLRAAYHFTAMGGDCYYCAASLDIQKVLCDNHVPIVAHVGLIPSYITWTGFRAVGKTAQEALRVWNQVKQLEAIGAFGAELEVVPDRVGEFISKNTSMIMLGMGAGPGADAQYLFAEDVLGYTRGHKPRHAKTYRDFAAEHERLQKERIAAFGEFIADVNSGAYPQPQHVVPLADEEFEAFAKLAKA
jgi:3-methyl-2-oxobutanoate hydroxymethyltransferase